LVEGLLEAVGVIDVRRYVGLLVILVAWWQV